MIVLSYILMTLLMFSGLFLIGLILLQRGRGGGLAGAFGGMGGQSAFGTKAGDVFTRITIGVATAWILLCAGNVIALHNSGDRVDQGIYKKAGAKDAATETELPKAPANDVVPPAASDDKKPEAEMKAQDAAPQNDAAKPAEPAQPDAEKAPAPPKADADPAAADKPAEPKPAEPKPEAPAEQKPQ